MVSIVGATTSARWDYMARCIFNRRMFPVVMANGDMRLVPYNIAFFYQVLVSLSLLRNAYHS